MQPTISSWLQHLIPATVFILKHFIYSLDTSSEALLLFGGHLYSVKACWKLIARTLIPSTEAALQSTKWGETATADAAVQVTCAPWSRTVWEM